MNELDAVLLVMTMSQAERFLPILRRYGTQADLIGTDSLSHIQFSSEHRGEPTSAPEHLEGLLLPVPFIPETASRGARDFMAEYEAKIGDSPTWAALFGYDTVLVLAAALDRISSATMSQRILSASRSCRVQSSFLTRQTRRPQARPSDSTRPRATPIRGLSSPTSGTSTTAPPPRARW